MREYLSKYVGHSSCETNKFIIHPNGTQNKPNITNITSPSSSLLLITVKFDKRFHFPTQNVHKHTKKGPPYLSFRHFEVPHVFIRSVYPESDRKSHMTSPLFVFMRVCPLPQNVSITFITDVINGGMIWIPKWFDALESVKIIPKS